MIQDIREVHLSPSVTEILKHARDALRHCSVVQVHRAPIGRGKTIPGATSIVLHLAE